MNIKILTLGSQTSGYMNSETPIEEVPLLSPCTTTTTTPPTTPMLSQNSGYIASRTTNLLPHVNGDPRSKTQNLKPKTQKPKTQISNLMLQWNYEHTTFDNSNTKLLPDLNADPRSNTQNLKPKTQISDLMLQWNYEWLSLIHI